MPDKINIFKSAPLHTLAALSSSLGHEEEQQQQQQQQQQLAS
jgi:hypothetical protein